MQRTKHNTSYEKAVTVCSIPLKTNYNSFFVSAIPIPLSNTRVNYEKHALRVSQVIVTVAKILCKHGLWLVVRVNKKAPKTRCFERREPDLNRRILVLQTIALPLGYRAISDSYGI